MTTPLAKPPLGPRRSPRRSKRDSTLMAVQNNMSNSETSPPPQSKTAAADSASPQATNTKIPSSANRKNSHGAKKQTPAFEPDRQTSHVKTTSQTNLLPPNKKATPLKQAYAGPTFHSSPAASSLPMPSFFSKSLPAVTGSPSLASTTQLDGQGHPDSDSDTLMPIRSEDSTPRGREPSPLDFMFEAARKARESPKTQSPDFRVGRLSPFDDIPVKKPPTPGDPSSDQVFPFELDGNGGRPTTTGSPFPTPFKDRMEGVRSSNAQSLTSPQDLDEKARKEKSEALKKLLINASPLRSPYKPDMNSYFPDRAGQTQSASPTIQRYRQGSGLPTPPSMTQHAPVPRHYIQNMPTATPDRDTPIQRPVSSHLRREYQPDHYQAPAELDSDSGTPPRCSPGSRNNRHSVSGQTTNNFGARPPYSNASSSMQTRPSHSAQKLEDDLRRVLKLDLTLNS